MDNQIFYMDYQVKILLQLVQTHKYGLMLIQIGQMIIMQEEMH